MLSQFNAVPIRIQVFACIHIYKCKEPRMLNTYWKKKWRRYILPILGLIVKLKSLIQHGISTRINWLKHKIIFGCDTTVLGPRWGGGYTAQCILKCKSDTIKLSEENTGRTLFDRNCSKIFLDPQTKVMKINTNINKEDLIKLKNFCTAKETINKTKKDNSQNGRKYLQMKQLTRDQSPKYANSSCSSIAKQQTTQSKNG